MCVIGKVKDEAAAEADVDVKKIKSETQQQPQQQQTKNRHNLLSDETVARLDSKPAAVSTVCVCLHYPSLSK